MDPERLTPAGTPTQRLAKRSSASPWPLEDERIEIAVAKAPVTQLHAVDTREASIRLAIAELQAYSNAELADLGITRGEIGYAVRHGREGFERVESTEVTAQSTTQSTTQSTNPQPIAQTKVQARAQKRLLKVFADRLSKTGHRCRQG